MKRILQVILIAVLAVSSGKLYAQTVIYGVADFDPKPGVKGVTYTSSNLAVATVTGTKLHIVGAGTTTITAKSGTTSQSQVLTVNKAPLKVTADNKTKAYGAAIPALTLTYSGFVNGDTFAKLTTAPKASTKATTASTVNTYPITIAGGVSSNYDFTYTPGVLTVNKAILTVIADNKTKVYGAALPALTITYSGFVNNETTAKLTTLPKVSTAAKATDIASTYAIAVTGGAAANYSFVYTPGVLTITKAVLSVTADNKTKVYGAAVPALTFSYAGFVNGETVAKLTTVPKISTAATTASAANTYPITLAGGVAANYSFVYTPGVLTVSKAVLTVTADDKTKVYGAALPAFTLTYAGFVNGDTFAKLTTAPKASTTATIASSVKTYPITLAGGVAANYSFVYTPGVLTVSKAALTLKPADKTKIYGAALPALTLTYVGLVSGDTAAKFTTVPKITTTAKATSPVNTYPITVTGGASANYSFTYAPGVLTVSKAAVTVNIHNKTKVQGADNPFLTYNYTGFVNGDTINVISTEPLITTTATAASPAGTYPITGSGATAANYSFTYKAGILTVTPAPVPTEVPVSTIAGNGTNKFGGDRTQATAASLLSPTDIVRDSKGNIYIAGGHRIRRIDAVTKVITTFAGIGVKGFAGDGGLATEARFNFNQSGLAVDTAGNLYVSDDGNNRIRKIDIKTNIITTIAGTGVAGSSGDNGPAIAATLNGPGKLVVDIRGIIYFSDYLNQRIRKIIPQTNLITTMRVGTLAEGIAVDRTANYLFLTSGSRILRLNILGNTLSVFGGVAFPGYAGDGGSVFGAQFGALSDVAVDSYNNMYVSDLTYHVVRKINMLTNIVTTYAGKGMQGFSGDGGAAILATFNGPTALTTDQAGNIYVCDRDNARIRKIGSAVVQTIIFPVIAPVKIGSADVALNAVASSGLPVTYTSSDTTVVTIVNGKAHLVGQGSAMITARQGGNINFTPVQLARTIAVISSVTSTAKIFTIAGNGINAFAGDGGAAKSASLANPYAMAKDSKGNIYLATADSRIRRIDAATGIITTVAGTGVAGFSGDGGLAKNAQLNIPRGALTGIAVDATGNVYIADTFNQRIRKITVTTGIITTLIGNGTPGFSGDLGLAANSFIADPEGIAVDAAGNIYFTDQYGSLVRKIAVGTNKVTTVAGRGPLDGYQNNMPATDVLLGFVERITLDKSGNLYIADSGYGVIRKVTTSTGILTNIGGNFNNGYNGDGGLATSASLASFMGLAVDDKLNIYIADQSNNAVRRIDGVTKIITTVAGTGLQGYSGDNGPANLASMFYPSDVSLDKNGDLYILDYANNVVRKVGANNLVMASVKQDTLLAANATKSNAETSDAAVSVNKAVSPNGDGVNDVLTITGIDKYTDNKLTIVNTKGALVYDAQGYNNLSTAFDGHSNITGARQLPLFSAERGGRADDRGEAFGDQA
ncbi:MAG: hypothetical protein EOP51_17095, partial [Sphingobacteriales bacterium]